MSIGRTNASGGGTGATLTVTAPAGVTVTATKDGKVRYRTANAKGVAIFKGLATGTWAVTISDGEHNPTTQQVLIAADYTMVIAFFAATIAVTYPMGSTCTCVKSGQVLTAPDTSGNYTFTVPEVGDWIISCTDGTQTASKTISITADGQAVSASLNYNTIPEFTYSGDYEIVDDADTPITTSDGNWKIRFLTSGVFTPTDLRGAADGIDVFLVGGGAAGRWGGGGGGYTATGGNVAIASGTDYSIVIGAGGTGGSNSAAKPGGGTSAFGLSANGGKVGGTNYSGGSGGCGGGGGLEGSGTRGGNGGSDGGDGKIGDGPAGGKGQGTTTREFGEASGKLYAGGGGGEGGGQGGEGGGGNGTNSTGKQGTENTGGGGGGGNNGSGGKGGSGIVIIRNARGVA